MSNFYKSLFIGLTAITIVIGLQNADIPPQPRAVAQTETKTVEAPRAPVKKKVVKHAPKKKKANSKPVVQPRAILQPKPVAVRSNSGSCADWMARAGIGGPDADFLILHESGCRPDAINPSSGACGIPQALPCSKMKCTLQDPVCQLRWMDSYIKARYGSWANAKAFWVANNWY